MNQSPSNASFTVGTGDYHSAHLIGSFKDQIRLPRKTTDNHDDKNIQTYHHCKRKKEVAGGSFYAFRSTINER